MANIRMSRINSEMQKSIAEIIANRLRNPDLDGIIITVTNVDTASDLKYAKVMVSVLSTPQTQSLVVQELNRAKAYIRKELMHMIRLRTMPELDFRLDDSYEKGRKIMDIIDSISGDNNE